MSKKKTEFDKAVERAARIILDQLSTLPPEIAKKKRLELEQMASRLPAPQRTENAHGCSELGRLVFQPDLAQKPHKFSLVSVLVNLPQGIFHHPDFRTCVLAFGIFLPLDRVPNFLLVRDVGRMV